MKITMPPNSHPTCIKAKALAEKIAALIESEGYDGKIQIDPYTLCREGQVNINITVDIDNEFNRVKQ